MKVVIAEPVADKLVELIKTNNRNWEVYIDKPKDKAELLERLKDAEIASSYSIKYNAEIFAACPKLKYLAIPAVGAGFFVDMKSAEKYGVTVLNCPGYNALAVAELAIALCIDVLRKISLQNSQIHNGLWQLEPSPGFLLSRKNVGLIGYGNVGKTIEQLLKSWSVNIQYVNSSSDDKAVDDLLQTSDVVIVCCPLTEKTKGMINAKRLQKIKNSAILVNVARGAVVDEDELYKKLANKDILGAGLDVFVDEPSQNNEVPNSIMRFSNLENVVCTPHIAGGTLETRDILGQMIYDDIVSCQNNNPINIYKESF